MTTFDFDDGPEVQGTNLNGTNTLTFTDSGVTFTVSVVDPAPTSNVVIHNPNGNAGFLQFNESASVPNDNGVGDEFILNPQATNENFSGTVAGTFFLVSGTWTVNLQSTGGGSVSQVVGPGVSQTFSLGTSGTIYNQISFTSSGANTFVLLETLTATVTCYAPGTAIGTPKGQVPVESLTPGDMVLTADGRETPVKWVGRQPVDTQLMHPAKVNPIRITAGALGYNLPERDLRLSPDHAIELDGYLINASALVNGTTIYQEQGKLPGGFTYYHIETEAHELLLAEGVAAESFVDYVGRDAFDNGNELGNPIPEMDLPRISSARLVPAHLKAMLEPKVAAE